MGVARRLWVLESCCATLLGWAGVEGTPSPLADYYLKVIKESAQRGLRSRGPGLLCQVDRARQSAYRSAEHILGKTEEAHKLAQEL